MHLTSTEKLLKKNGQKLFFSVATGQGQSAVCSFLSLQHTFTCARERMGSQSGGKKVSGPEEKQKHHGSAIIEM